MSLARCRVAFTDSHGIVHAVEVQAESLYEAVALAVAEFRQGEIITETLGPKTEFIVTVHRMPIEHRISMNHVAKMGRTHDKRRTSGHHATGKNQNPTRPETLINTLADFIADI